MNESDWKKFTKIKKQALEEYCRRVNKDIVSLVQDKEKTQHEIYLDIYQLVKKRDKQLVNIFDEHTRSQAWLQFLQMRQQNLVLAEQLESLSNEFIEATDPERIKVNI